jgi:hypothetical protein
MLRCVPKFASREGEGAPWRAPPSLPLQRLSLRTPPQQASVLCVFHQPCWFPTRRASYELWVLLRSDATTASLISIVSVSSRRRRTKSTLGRPPVTPQPKVRAPQCRTNTIYDRCIGASTRRALHSNSILHKTSRL